MTIWTFKSPFAALAFLTLSACEGGQGLPLPGLPGGGDKPLSQTTLAGGAIRVVPPDGYCIDPQSLKSRFALMARCDSLGQSEVNTSTPLGVLTLALVPADPEAPLPTPQEIAEALNLTQISEVGGSDGATIFVAEGPVPAVGMSGRHWRGMASISGHLVSVTLYGAPQSRALSDEGRGLVAALIRRTRAQSAGRGTAAGS